MGGKSSRTKGHREERQVKNDLEAFGIKAERNLNQTREGGCDVITDEWAIECKRKETWSVPADWKQAAEQADRANKRPVLTLKRNREERLAVIRWTDFLVLALMLETLEIKEDFE